MEWGGDEAGGPECHLKELRFDLSCSGEALKVVIFSGRAVIFLLVVEQAAGSQTGSCPSWQGAKQLCLDACPIFPLGRHDQERHFGGGFNKVGYRSRMWMRRIGSSRHAQGFVRGKHAAGAQCTSASRLSAETVVGGVERAPWLHS